LHCVQCILPNYFSAALSEILDAIATAEYTGKLSESKEKAGNDMQKMMQYVFPVIVQIQMDVIKNYGFPEGRDGIVHFSQLIRNMERDDEEVAHLHSQIRAHFLPPVHINTEASL